MSKSDPQLKAPLATSALIPQSALKVINGLASGYIGAIAVYPIDLVKTQVQNGGGRAYSVARSIIQQQGFIKMYNGSFVQLIGIGPEKAIKLYVNDVAGGYGLHPIICGAMAGACQVLVTNPIEYVKIQYQMNVKDNMSLFQTIRQLGGFRSLYKGSSLCLMRDMPFSAIYFPTYSYLKSVLPENSHMSNLIGGTVAALPAAYLVTPLDVIKTKIQTPGQTQNYKGMLDLVSKMYRNEGLRVFFRGGDMRVLKSCPQFGITLFFYELLK
jgi:solute carrier family 25 aspartate/glutamate transporter 12/13